MSDGEAYRDDLCADDVCGDQDAIAHIQLLLTSRRVAVRVIRSQDIKVFVWDLESGHLVSWSILLPK